MLCNIMTGTGFAMGFMGGFSMAWMGLVILFFAAAFARKWLGEETGMGFNFFGGLAGAFIPYLIIVSVACSPRWALLVGIVGLIIGGFGLGMFTGSGDE